MMDGTYLLSIISIGIKPQKGWGFFVGKMSASIKPFVSFSKFDLITGIVMRLLSPGA